MHHWAGLFLLAMLAIASAGSAEEGPGEGPMSVYFGTYTGGESRGIYRSEFEPGTGSLTEPALVAETPNPSFLTVQDGRFLYAVNEVGEYEGAPTGTVSAFAIEPGTGTLSFLNRQPSGGGAPCHLVIDQAGMYVLVANYTGGSVAVLPIDDDGRLKPASSIVRHSGSSINPQRQKEPHAHSINRDPTNRFALAADLGLDKVLVYRLESGGLLRANEPAGAALKPGSGPRHLAFRPDGKFAYVIGELDSTVTVLAFDPANGTLAPIQSVSTLPSDFAGTSHTAEVQVHPGGKFLYGSNRGHDSVCVFGIAGESGQLSLVEIEPTGGRTPRNFGIDPTGRFLLAANQETDSVVVFAIDPETGALEPTGEKLNVPAPVCVKFLALK